MIGIDLKIQVSKTLEDFKNSAWIIRTEQNHNIIFHLTFRFRNTIAGFEGSACLLESKFSITDRFLVCDVGAIPAEKSTSNSLSSSENKYSVF